MTGVVVEIWVPLVATSEVDYAYPWIEDIEEFLDENERVEIQDDGEEMDDHYVFFINEASEAVLLDVAREVAARPGVPEGAYAMVTTEDAEDFGLGRRVPLAR